MTRRARFSAAQAAKKVLHADTPGHHPASTAVAGACATVVADAIFTPLDTVKQRLQIANSPYTGMINCASRTLRDEGWQAFFRSCALRSWFTGRVATL
jgi:solute carrier family 25 iron transporter 28/37